MRIIFMGSPEFAVPALNALVEAGHEVVAVYCQPPRPAGRGKADRQTAVQKRAEQLGLEVRTPRTLRECSRVSRGTVTGAPSWDSAAPMSKRAIEHDGNGRR